MRSPHIVYLDCDGVYADFVTNILDAMGYSWPGYHGWPWGQTFDIFPDIGTTWIEASKYCDANFWANLSWMEDGRAILAEVFARFRPNETMLLTKPMEHDGSYTGKAQWVLSHIPDLARRIVPTHVPKYEFAYDFNCLLIDDSQTNYDQFVRAGGAGILVPRPYNANEEIFYAGDTVKYVAERMDKWIELVKHPAGFESRKELRHG